MNLASAERVLLCSDYLPPSDGGVEQVVQKLAVHLRDRGFEVGVFTLDDGTREFDLEHVSGVSFYTASAVDLTDRLGLQSMFSVSALDTFRRVVDEFRPDVVHAHNRFFYTSALAALFSLRADYELVTTLHLGDVGMISGAGGTAARGYERTVGRFVVSRSRHVICVSRAVEAVARSLGADDSVVIRNAVDVDEFTPTPRDGKSLLYIGRYVQNNGIRDLLEALPGILDAHPDAEVHLVGSGPLENHVRDTVRGFESADSVTVHGYVEDITEMYDLATVFCRPSYSEGLPLTLLEAMAAGVPPVVTDIAGVPEVVTHRETGLLLQPGHPAGIEAGVTELFDDPKLCDQIARNARKYIAENLTWERRTEKVIDVYERVASAATERSAVP